MNKKRGNAFGPNKPFVISQNFNCRAHEARQTDPITAHKNGLTLPFFIFIFNSKSFGEFYLKQKNIANFDRFLFNKISSFQTNVLEYGVIKNFLINSKILFLIKINGVFTVRRQCLKLVGIL